MPHDPINTGYARALFELAQAEAVLSRVEEELFRLRELLRANPALLEFLKEPNIKLEGKRQALSELFQGRVHPLVLDGLVTISDQNRGGRLLAIIKEFGAIASNARQQVSGTVTTAIGLDGETLARLTAALDHLTGKRIQLFTKIDPTILGGAIVQVGDQIIDASLRHKLNQLKNQLVQ